MKNISKIRTGMAVKIFVGLIGYIGIMYIIFGAVLSTFTYEELEVISEEELYSFLSSNVEIFSSIGIVVLSTYFLMGMGSLLAFFGLRGFMRDLDMAGSKGASSLATAYLLNAISYGLLLVLYYMYNSAMGSTTAAIEDSVAQNTVLGVVAMVLFIVAFIMKIMGYSTLRTTASLDEMGSAGVKKLYKGFMFYIVSIIALFVPMIGIYAFLILLILSWVSLLGGWAKVRESFRLNELNKIKKI